MPRATDLVFALLLAFDLESASADANKAPRPLKGRRTHSIRARRYLVLEERRRLKRNAVLNSHVAFATNRKRRRLVAAEYEKKIQFLPLPSVDFLVAGSREKASLLFHFRRAKQPIDTLFSDYLMQFSAPFFAHFALLIHSCGCIDRDARGPIL